MNPEMTLLAALTVGVALTHAFVASSACAICFSFILKCYSCLVSCYSVFAVLTCSYIYTVILQGFLCEQVNQRSVPIVLVLILLT